MEAICRVFFCKIRDFSFFMHPNFLKKMRFGFNEVRVMLCLFGGLSVLFELFHG